MPKKRLPIFRIKFAKIFKVSIFVAKMRKPVIPRLVLFRKSQRLRKFELLRNKHYNYGFISEYEFSPSKELRLKNYHGRLQRVCYSVQFLCRCLRGEGGDFGDLPLQLEALPAAVDHDQDRVIAGALFKPLDWGDGDAGADEGEDSIDLRAERFIERFYEEMRMQRQASL